MKDLQNTAQNLNKLTDENSELNLALTQFKTFGEHLSGLNCARQRALADRSPISKKLAPA
jgi:hypothetical protein